MSTLITDTIKPKNGANFTLAELEDIWQNDNTKVSDAIAPATDTKLGRIKLGDNLSIDEDNLINIPNYLYVGAEEPTNGAKLWISTKEQYIPPKITNVGVSAQENNMLKMKEDGLYLQGIDNAIVKYPGTLDWDGQLISLSKTIQVYFNAQTGDDVNGNGTSANPLKTVSTFLNKCPRSTNGYSYQFYLQGDFTGQGSLDFYGFTNQNLQLYMVNNPKFKGLRFFQCRRVYTYRGFTIVQGTPQSNNLACLGAHWGSWVACTSDLNAAFTITITGGSNSNTTWNVRGVQAGLNSVLALTNGNSTIKVTGCRYGALADGGSLLSIYHTNFSSNYRGFQAGYGIISYCSTSGYYTNSVISGGAAMTTANGGLILNGANRSGTAY